MTSKRTGRGTVLFGLFVLIAGLAGAVVLYLLSLQRGDDAIHDLARAPVGCDTTLEFSDTGTFYMYVEHRGTLEALDGDCETPAEYSRDVDDEPTVQITVTDGSGVELELDRLDDEFTYSIGESVAGTAKRRFEVDTTGDYVVTVDSDDNDFVVAVGRDPRDAADTMRLGAFVAGVSGIVLGLGLVLVGVRRGRRVRRIATTYTAAPRWPVGAPAPTAPPAMQPPHTPRLPPPQQHGEWSSAPPVGPPVVSPGQPNPGWSAPPSVFAPPEMPNQPISTPTRSPIVPGPPGASDTNTGDAPAAHRGDGDDGGEIRGDASP